MKAPSREQPLGGRCQQIQALNSARGNMGTDPRPELVRDSPTSKLGRHCERPKERHLTQELQTDGADEHPAGTAQDEMIEVARLEVVGRQLASGEEISHARKVIWRRRRVVDVVHESLHGDGKVCPGAWCRATTP